MKPVLVVDDDERNRYLLQTMLTGNGYDVVTAVNGAEALALARKEPPAVIIADALMPVMDGYTLCRRWMEDETLRTIPFIFHTATYTDQRDEELGLALGAARFIASPAEPGAVVAELRSVLAAAAQGQLAAPPAPGPDEAAFLRQYNEALIRKLESKLAQLEQAGRALAESDRLRLSLLESISDAFLAVDHQWKLTFFNKRAEQLLRRALPNAHRLALGTPLVDVFPQLVPAVPELAQETVPSGMCRSPFEVHFPPTAAWFAVHVYRSGDGLAVLFHEITERKKEAQALQRLNDQLEERVARRTAELEMANKELATFSYSVSHDLRAPLRAINGFSRMLLEEHGPSLDPDARDYVERIHANTAHMGDLIDSLLSLSRVTRSELRVEPVDLSAMAGAIVARLKKSEPQRVVDAVIAPDVVAQGDTHLLEVALDNLLSNAWKFTSREPRARIEFGVTSQDGETVYFVRDDGAGFDQIYADRLFKPFQRLHTAGEFEGTGIGLATVQRVIDRHGGRIWSESAVGEGATFFFTLEPSPAAVSTADLATAQAS